MKRHPPGCAQCGEKGLSSFVITACGAGEIKLCVACNRSTQALAASARSCGRGVRSLTGPPKPASRSPRR